MDYEKKYKEALERARQLYDSATNIGDIVGCDLESIFPELAESEDEDERIRKELIEYHKQQFEKNRDQEVGLFHNAAIAYLEKEKAQKPISIPTIPTYPANWGCDGTHCTNPQMDCINCPRKTTGGSFSTSSATGTSAATLHGNTSATDGKPHNPSFTD